MLTPKFFFIKKNELGFNSKSKCWKMMLMMMIMTMIMDKQPQTTTTTNNYERKRTINECVIRSKTFSGTIFQIIIVMMIIENGVNCFFIFWKISFAPNNNNNNEKNWLLNSTINLFFQCQICHLFFSEKQKIWYEKKSILAATITIIILGWDNP